MYDWTQIIAIIASILTIGSVTLNVIQYRTRKSHEKSLIAHLWQTYNWLYQIARFAEKARNQCGKGTLLSAGELMVTCAKSQGLQTQEGRVLKRMRRRCLVWS